ncbi:sensor histidine kinase [Cohnella suwonensis]|uniref:histidine kinase n=1 Tax=Cohnella suwonensis TaxID=696072 RepID=A0ABW0LY52_9BACL
MTVLRLTRIASGIVILIGIALFLYAVPTFYVDLRDHCVDQVCSSFYDTPPTSAWLDAHGLNSRIFAGAYAGLYGLFGLAYIGVGIVVFLRKSADLIGQVASVALALQGFTFNALSLSIQGVHPAIDFTLRAIEACSIVALMTLFFVFPNGKFDPSWSRYALIVILVPGLLRGFFPGTSLDLKYLAPTLFPVWVLVWMGSLIAIQVYRYRKVLGPIERQQTKWAVAGMSVAIAGLIVITLLHILQEDALQRNPFYLYFSDVVLVLCMMLLPITLLFALLRRKLWDIDPIVNRTLVYGSLSLFVAAIYVGIVWYVGVLFHAFSPWANSLIATGIVAILFTPVKERLQRFVNRWMYGENDDPLAVLARLGRKLENPLSPHDALHVVVRTVREALRLPYAGIELVQNGEAIILSEDGDPAQAPAPVKLPLVHRGDSLGHLLVAPRSPEESFFPSDRKFLDMLVRQAGAVVQSAKASIDLHFAAEDLRESRERLVLAREEERKRLRRNLHDDLAPRLAALALTASAAETLMQTDPATTKTILAELQTVIRTSVSDIRRLVHDLRPPALDELGLVGAIQERINDLSRPLKPAWNAEEAFSNESAPPPRLRFRLYAPDSLPPLPAAVEVAAFRIVTEAIVNVVRHSGATECDVSLTVRASAGGDGDGGLAIVIVDNGHGMGDRRESNPSGGIGQHSMRERAEELGGYCLFEAAPRGGSKVSAWLPLTLEVADNARQEGGASA